MKCIKCNEEKSNEFFSLIKRNGNENYRTVCKDCYNNHNREYYKKTIKYQKERKIEYRKIKGKEIREKEAERYWNNLEKEKARKAKFYKENKEVIKKRIKKYRKNNPDKRKAHWTVSNMIKSGKLKKPKNCSKCTSDRFLEAHHEDYSKPKEVIWLCKSCHRKAHNGEY